MSGKRRLVVLASHPIQYQAPLFRALTLDERLELHVLFMSRHGVEERTDPGFGVAFRWDSDLLEGYSASFLPNIRERAQPGRLWSYVNPGVVKALRQQEPDALMLLGVRSPTGLAALEWAARRRIRTLYRAESSVLQRRTTISRALARAVLRRVDAVASIGTANDLYYEALGIEERRRYLAPYTVDNAFFRSAAGDHASAREELAIPAEDVVLLYAGKLVAWKDPGTLIASAAALGPGVHVVVAGDGPLRAGIERQAARLGVRLRILGFLNQSEILVAYRAADLLVVPSLLEPWGLVVNEAMCAGRPVVASSRVGARLDLVTPGINGEVFRAGEAAALSGVLSRLVRDPAQLKRYGSAASARIAAWSLDHTVAGLVAAVADE